MQADAARLTSSVCDQSGLFGVHFCRTGQMFDWSNFREFDGGDFALHRWPARERVGGVFLMLVCGLQDVMAGRACDPHAGMVGFGGPGASNTWPR